ncbi:MULTISPECIES: hypothetical protein [Paraclostridium]|uniref:Uncharacterized protein n=1 Tax=Paraclostridium bifermentans TaxID=1490 RepID=A0AA44DNL4_PARBF|nr:MULTISPECIES: hypothetical protein [Paraclostridium]MCU9809293.1 hypothetical protein [Paraclostridium sp. AKS46]EQK40048.1 hypothetical protein C671_2935 [[Clostridium] bifermentans ATCC 19299] [Paraclostridium bifermentans ATCC 19299]MBN8049376.1 hypothetical protein [Paraclostridium bifermentans]MBS6509617.1 hypothetical protein [Paraclostridium bifermentans]MBU5289897.1 hypothetical protein [Paraclostridium bifermentans]
MTIENPMLNKKSSLLNIKQKVDEKSTGQEFIENKNTDINVFDLINKPKLKEEKVMIGIKLKKEIADKVKSFSYENNMTVSQVLEDIVCKMFDSVELNVDALTAYEEKYKKKSKKTKK